MYQTQKRKKREKERREEEEEEDGGEFIVNVMYTLKRKVEA